MSIPLNSLSIFIVDTQLRKLLSVASGDLKGAAAVNHYEMGLNHFPSFSADSTDVLLQQNARPERDKEKFSKAIRDCHCTTQRKRVSTRG